MLDTTKAHIRSALDVVTNPQDFSHIPSVQQDAWRELKLERGQDVRFDTLPTVTHATPRPDNDLCRKLSQPPHGPAPSPSCIDRIRQRARELGLALPVRGAAS